MKINSKKLITILLIVFGIVVISVPFWNNSQKKSEKEKLPEGVFKGEVVEILQTTKYTYLLMEEGGAESWIAVTKREAKEGDVYYYTNPLEMNNFESKELGKTFETVFFVQNISDQPLTGNETAAAPAAERKQEAPEKIDTSVPKAKGGITIAELYENHTQYANQVVTISGKVTKYNPMIMGKNWVHIQDGSDFSGNFDLTFTTDDTASLDQILTVKGKVSLNKDFGAGYFFKIILEDAEIQVK